MEYLEKDSLKEGLKISTPADFDVFAQDDLGLTKADINNSYLFSRLIKLLGSGAEFSVSSIYESVDGKKRIHCDLYKSSKSIVSFTLDKMPNAPAVAISLYIISNDWNEIV